ncbi:sigma-54-dependent transcriptional regulator [Spirosoma rhododendri]|uniref:Sigma-54-dependent Fis family transcriptional regulator n=1 Tax=Spirosoma rhododendri TaxID=2728024 RepID=A0A7L5DTT2_9BACT|nr:sigma-54 dependent transcriptional regulator [Spirosoma rhododendri]QJD81535.1 sigma-54-dependent Fis family transcriptional regulator [Spirosoma rhododendri]
MAVQLLKKASVLVVDDDTDVLTSMAMLLRPEVRVVQTEKNPERLPALLRQETFDLVLLDMNYHRSVNTSNEGLYWLQQLRTLAPASAVVLITAYADINLAIRGLKDGAADFVVKPWRNDKLLASLDEALTRRQLTNKSHRQLPKPAVSPLLGESTTMQTLRRTIEKIAPTDANVLILGENGTGKDVVARLIHAQSMRASQPFVGVDLGALSEPLLESELFGYVKGAFTDARQDRAGRFEAAAGGTLFLDEIGNLSLPGQTKLLTALQQRQITRLGSHTPIPVDVRVVSATNAPIQHLVQTDRFRKDLVYRLNTIELTLPPLRERGDDVRLLAAHFLEQYATKYGKPTPRLEGRALARLLNYRFPGNVRELQHTMERAVVMSESEVLTAEDLVFSSVETTLTAGPETTRLAELEKGTIQKVVDKHHGNITKAAKELGITRMALYRRLGKYDL